MPQFKDKADSPTSRTIHINPHFNKQIHPMANCAANAVISKTMSSGAHINPLFLGVYRPPAIHMNPNFFNSKLIEQQKLQLNYGVNHSEKVKLVTKNTPIKKNPSKNLLLHGEIIDLCGESDQEVEKSSLNTKSNILPVSKDPKQKIITKSRTKIVREPAAITTTKVMPVPSPLIRLSSKKLVRRTHTTSAVSLLRNITPASPKSTHGKYKLDRRPGLPLATTAGVKLKRKSFVARYALQRSNSETKNAITSSKLRSLPVNKKLQMLNINGVLYRSTRNKLQRKDSSNASNPLSPARVSSLSVKTNSIKNNQKPIKTANERVLFVHGTKFVLDKNGFKLTRIAPTTKDNVTGTPKPTIPAQRQRQRIDIGGLTYIASTTQNVFVRTRNHLALAHLNTAKNRSLQLLTRRFVKTNVPCAIFQRIGKCIAHERGKCNKVHDKNQVTICPRFLRSECHNSNCLLSHNVSLAKMPVCKFFLQGVCVRPDCPYLHKKLSVNAEICQDFLRGYCKLAEQCNKRHEFLCPEYERNGSCDLAGCVYCKNRKRKLLNEPTKQQNKQVNSVAAKEVAVPGTQENSGIAKRYFIDRCLNANATTTCDMTVKDEDAEKQEIDTHSEELDSDTEMPSAPMRPKVGALPAFIPLL
uniref:Zinc finger CCCH domain-containing protein 7 n=1 Tax=Bactrocera latifrons TaxID=174628 RepID=A0A0K8WI90_BACLA